MITVTSVDIKKTLTFTRCYSLTVKQCVVIVCTAVRRQAPALLAALPLLTQQDTSPTLHSFSSDHPFNWLWRPSGLGNSSFDLSSIWFDIIRLRAIVHFSGYCHLFLIPVNCHSSSTRLRLLSSTTPQRDVTAELR